MGYQKVYFDEIWKIDHKAESICEQWSQQLDSILKEIRALCDGQTIKGNAADSINAYLNEVHSSITGILTQILGTYMCQLTAYYYQYTTDVDSGDGSKHGTRYTTIHHQEVKESGTEYERLRKLLKQANQAERDALKIKKQLKSLVSLTIPESGNTLGYTLTKAMDKAVMIDRKVSTFEARHQYDLRNINELLVEVKKLINYQLSVNRIAAVHYVPGAVASMCDVEKAIIASEGCAATINDFNHSDYAAQALALARNRDSMIHEEEKDGRKWANGIKVGVVVVVSAASIVATAGASTPAAAAAIGAIAGAVGGAVETTTNYVVDSYVETGDGLQGIDASDFGRDYLVAVGGGALFGSISSKTKFLEKTTEKLMPIEKGLNNLAFSVTKTGTEEGFKTAWNFGNALIEKKNWDETMQGLYTDSKNTLKNMLVNGGGEFVGGYYGAQKEILKDKNVKITTFQAVKDKVKESVYKAGVKGGTAIAFDTIDLAGNAGMFLKTRNLKETLASNQNFANSLKTLQKDVDSGMKNVIVAGISGGPTAIIKHSVESDTSDKGTIRIIAEDTAMDGVDTISTSSASAVYRIGKGVIFNDGTEDPLSVLRDEAGKWREEWAKKRVQSILETTGTSTINFMNRPKYDMEINTSPLTEEEKKEWDIIWDNYKASAETAQ